jgi:ATP-dependent DNA helicase RecQ
MKDYAENRDCRRQYILNYFGEVGHENCGYCDNCETGSADREDAKVEAQDLPFPLKARVLHRKFGEGVVMGYDADKINIQFDKEGARSLVTQFVLDNKLMTIV